MKTWIQSVKLTIFLCMFLSVSYIGVLWATAKCVGPNQGNVELLKINNRVVGTLNIGQSFQSDKYFWNRPSANNYDGRASGGSNMAMSNQQYINQLNVRIRKWEEKHPYLTKADIPLEMITASASGLDPDISIVSAYIQIRRIAAARGCNDDMVRHIVDKTQSISLLGPNTVNVLKLNIALDKYLPSIERQHLQTK